MTETPPPFAYHAPGEALREFVAFYYVLHVGDRPFDEQLCALLGQIQIGRGGVADYALPRGWTPAPPVAVIGPTDQATRMRAPAGFVAVGCGLTPAGWSRLFPSGSGLANAIAPVPGGQPDIDGEIDDAAAIEALESWLDARLAPTVTDPRIKAIDDWVVAGPADDVDALARELGMSRRGLERLTRRTHGATPKRLSAKYRSLKIAAELAVGTAHDWSQVGVASGLSDQSHFIREFTRYVGMTPGAFAADRDSFVHRLIAGRWAPGREMSIALWA